MLPTLTRQLPGASARVDGDRAPARDRGDEEWVGGITYALTRRRKKRASGATTHPLRRRLLHSCAPARHAPSTRGWRTWRARTGKSCCDGGARSSRASLLGDSAPPHRRGAAAADAGRRPSSSPTAPTASASMVIALPRSWNGSAASRSPRCWRRLAEPRTAPPPPPAAPTDAGGQDARRRRRRRGRRGERRGASDPEPRRRGRR